MSHNAWCPTGCTAQHGIVWDRMLRTGKKPTDSPRLRVPASLARAFSSVRLLFSRPIFPFLPLRRCLSSPSPSSTPSSGRSSPGAMPLSRPQWTRGLLPPQALGLLGMLLLCVTIYGLQLEGVGGRFETAASAESRSVSDSLAQLVGNLHISLAHPSYRRRMLMASGEGAADLVEFDERDMKLVEGEPGLDTLAAQAAGKVEVFACERGNWHSDICLLRGDIYVGTRLGSVTLRTHLVDTPVGTLAVKPYPAKRNSAMMQHVRALEVRSQVDERRKGGAPVGRSSRSRCWRKFENPAVMFSLEGLPKEDEEDAFWHEFADVLVPLYLTTHSYAGKVMLVIVGSNERPGFMKKYEMLLKAFTNQPILLVDSANEARQMWCFPQLIVGLQSRGPLLVNPHQSEGVPSIMHLQRLWGHLLGIGPEPLPPRLVGPSEKGLKLGLISRSNHKGRQLSDEARVVAAAQRLGFSVTLLQPEEMPLPELFSAVQQLDALAGTLGVGLTSLLFLRPNAALVHIIPFGCEPAKWEVYLAAARHLKYYEFVVPRTESSLSRSFTRDNTIFVHPRDSWNSKRGRRIYLNQRMNLTDETLADLFSHTRSLLTSPLPLVQL